MAVTKMGKQTYLYENFAMGTQRPEVEGNTEPDVAIVYDDQDNEERHIFPMSLAAARAFYDALGKEIAGASIVIPQGPVQ